MFLKRSLEDLERAHVCSDCGSTDLGAASLFCRSCVSHRADGHAPVIFVGEDGPWQCHGPREPKRPVYQMLPKLSVLDLQWGATARVRESA